MNFGGLFGGGGGFSLPMPPLPPGLPSLPGLGGGGMSGGGGSSLGGTMQTQSDGGTGGGGIGGTIQTEGDSGYTQNIAGLLQMLGANQSQPRTTVISGGGLI